MPAVTKKPKKRTVKSAKPPKTAKVKDFLSPSKAEPKKKKNSKKEKPVSHFPVDSDSGEFSLAERMDHFAAAHCVFKAAERKKKELEHELKTFLLKDFANRWAADKSKPVTRTWKGLRSFLNYTPTSRITFTVEKQEAIEETLDYSMDEDFSVTKIKIDIEKLAENEKYMKAFEKFLAVFEDDDLEDHVEREFKLKKNFFENIGERMNYDPERIHAMLKILDPSMQLRGVDSSEKEEDMFDFVRSMDGQKN